MKIGASSFFRRPAISSIGMGNKNSRAGREIKHTGDQGRSEKKKKNPHLEPFFFFLLSSSSAGPQNDVGTAIKEQRLFLSLLSFLSALLPQVGWLLLSLLPPL